MPKVTRKDTAGPLQEVLVPLPAEASTSQFPPLSAKDQNESKLEFRRVRPPPPTPQNSFHSPCLILRVVITGIAQVPVPQHRMTPLKQAWMSLYKPVTEQLKLDMRMNLKTKRVEIKTTKDTPDQALLQKAADFVHAYIIGFPG